MACAVAPHAIAAFMPGHACQLWPQHIPPTPHAPHSHAAPPATSSPPAPPTPASAASWSRGSRVTRHACARGPRPSRRSSCTCCRQAVRGEWGAAASGEVAAARCVPRGAEAARATCTSQGHVHVSRWPVRLLHQACTDLVHRRGSGLCIQVGERRQSKLCGAGGGLGGPPERHQPQCYGTAFTTSHPTWHPPHLTPP